MEQEIKDQKKYLQKAKDDIDALGDVIEGVEQIASGFQKIANFLKREKDKDSRVRMRQDRIFELEKMLAESKQ